MIARFLLVLAVPSRSVKLRMVDPNHRLFDCLLMGRLLPFAKGSEWTHSALLRSPMGASPLFTTKQQSIFLQALRNCPRKNCLHRPNQKHRPHTIPLNRNTPAITFNLNGIVQQPPTNPVNRSATRART